MSADVVRLPTAARRQVQQPRGLARPYREANPWPGEHKLPARRDAERAVRHLTAAEIIVQAMLESLPADARKAVADRVMRLDFLSEQDAARRAALIVARVGR